jgi:hypothetical protein
VFERALFFKRNPEEVRKFSEEVLALAQAMDKDPAEVERWDARDRRWLLTRIAAGKAK